MWNPFRKASADTKPTTGGYVPAKAVCANCGRALLPGAPCPFCNPQHFGETLEGTLNTPHQSAAKATVGMAGVAVAMGVASEHKARGFLYIFDGKNKGASVLLGDRTISIGREAGVNVLALNDGGVSTRHCAVNFQDGKYRLVDVGSKNGTFVNDKRVTDTEISNSDTIAIGGTRIYVGIL
jgi:hypothetical protein